MSKTNATLSKIETMLASVIAPEGTAPTQKMNVQQFAAYAQDQITKATEEAPEESTKRIKALHKAVQIAKDNFTDTDNESISVPIYVCDTTVLDDKSTMMMTPDASAAKNPSGQSIFENGFVAKLQADLAAAIKAMGEEPEEEPAKKGDGEQEEKSKKAEDVEENDDSMKAKAQKKIEPLAKADRAEDGTEWPNDLNDRDFVEKGTATKELTFGRD